MVVRTPRRQIHQKNIQRFQQRQKLNRLRQIRLLRIARVHAKSPPVRNQIRMRLGNSRAELRATCPIRRLRRIGMERHSIKRRNANANFQAGRSSANPFHNVAQKSRPILKTSPILPFPSMSPKKFMPQISMTMFQVDKIKTKLPSNARSAMKLLDNAFDFRISKHRNITSYTKPPIQNRMPKQNLRLRASMPIRIAVPP